METVEELRAQLDHDAQEYTMRLKQKDFQIEAHERHIAQLQDHCNSADAKVNMLAGENSKMSETIKSLQAKNQELQTQIDAMPELRDEYEKFKKLLAEKDDTIRRFRSELQMAEAKFAALKEAHGKMLDVF